MVSAVLLAGCGTVERVPTITVDGQSYVSTVPRGYEIPPSRLTEYGTATEIVDRTSIDGTTALALDGVPPTEILFMKSRLQDFPYLMFFATDLLAGSEPPSLLTVVPELCTYYTQGCPTGTN